MADSQFPDVKPTTAIPRSGTSTTRTPLQIVTLPQALQNNDKHKKLEGEVTSDASEDTVRIHTEEGEIELRTGPNVPKPKRGTKVNVEIPRGSPPERAKIEVIETPKQPAASENASIDATPERHAKAPPPSTSETVAPQATTPADIIQTTSTPQAIKTRQTAELLQSQTPPPLTQTPSLLPDVFPTLTLSPGAITALTPILNEALPHINTVPTPTSRPPSTPSLSTTFTLESLSFENDILRLISQPSANLATKDLSLSLEGLLTRAPAPSPTQTAQPEPLVNTLTTLLTAAPTKTMPAQTPPPTSALETLLSAQETTTAPAVHRQQPQTQSTVIPPLPEQEPILFHLSAITPPTPKIIETLETLLHERVLAGEHMRQTDFHLPLEEPPPNTTLQRFIVTETHENTPTQIQEIRADNTLSEETFTLPLHDPALSFGSILALEPYELAQAAQPVPDTPAQTTSPQQTTTTAQLPPPLTPLQVWSAAPWPLFNQIHQELSASPITAPLAQTLTSITPSPASPAQFTPAALFFLSAVRGGDIQSWLGERTVNALKETTKGRSLLSRLSSDIGTITRTSADSSGDWRVFNLPIYGDQGFERAALYLHQDQQNNEETTEQSGKTTRFIFNIAFDNMGETQIDGLYANKRLDVILRSPQAFSPAMHQELRQIYADALRPSGVTGELSFQHGLEHWVTISPPEHLHEMTEA